MHEELKYELMSFAHGNLWLIEKKCIIGFEFHPHKISFMNFNIISFQRKKAWKKIFEFTTM